MQREIQTHTETQTGTRANTRTHANTHTHTHTHTHKTHMQMTGNIRTRIPHAQNCAGCLLFSISHNCDISIRSHSSLFSCSCTHILKFYGIQYDSWRSTVREMSLTPQLIKTTTGFSPGFSSSWRFSTFIKLMKELGLNSRLVRVIWQLLAHVFILHCRTLPWGTSASSAPDYISPSYLISLSSENPQIVLISI
jgi:hypothetical protein